MPASVDDGAAAAGDVDAAGVGVVAVVVVGAGEVVVSVAAVVCMEVDCWELTLDFVVSIVEGEEMLGFEVEVLEVVVLLLVALVGRKLKVVGS